MFPNSSSAGCAWSCTSFSRWAPRRFMILSKAVKSARAFRLARISATCGASFPRQIDSCSYHLLPSASQPPFSGRAAAAEDMGSFPSFPILSVAWRSPPLGARLAVLPESRPGSALTPKEIQSVRPLPSSGFLEQPDQGPDETPNVRRGDRLLIHENNPVVASPLFCPGLEQGRNGPSIIGDQRQPSPSGFP